MAALKQPVSGAKSHAAGAGADSDACARAVGDAAWRDATPTSSTASSTGSAVTWGLWKRVKLKSKGRVTCRR